MLIVAHDVLILHQSNGCLVELPLALALFFVPQLVVGLAVSLEEVTYLIISQACILNPVPEAPVLPAVVLLDLSLPLRAGIRISVVETGPIALDILKELLPFFFGFIFSFIHRILEGILAVILNEVNGVELGWVKAAISTIGDGGITIKIGGV